MMTRNNGFASIEQFDYEVDNLDAALSLDGRTECFKQLSDACEAFAHNNRLNAQCACGAKVNSDQWRRINDAVMPGVREAILGNTLFVCPGCKKRLLFDYAVVYHAPRHRLLVTYIPKGQEVNLVSRINEHRYMQAGYNMRLVRSPLGIAEKVLIAQHGLCEISVEFYKYLTWGMLSRGGDKKLAQWSKDAWNYGLYVVDIQDHALSLKAGGETITAQTDKPVREFLGKPYLQQFIADCFGGYDSRVRDVVGRIQNARGWFLVEWRDIAGGLIQRQ